MSNLIIVPVGNPLTFDPRFDAKQHYRFTDKNERDYETLVLQYSAFEPEKHTYDKIIRGSGFKWQLVKKLFNTYPTGFNYNNYEYIGFFDDDIITDIRSINKSLRIARENDLKLFQLSVTEDSDMFYPILVNKPGIKYTKTNFNEVMAPFIHTSLIPICVELWNKYEIFSGWGFDKVLCDLTKTDAAVIHQYQMYHPKRVSSYDKTSAFKEMDTLLYDIFPKFMSEKYGENWQFSDRQFEKEIVWSINE